MQKQFFILALSALSACVPTADTPGTVTGMNSESVTIRGAADFSLTNAGKGFTPTPAMVAQAQEICPGARFVSGIGTPDTNFTADFLFACP